MDAIELLMADHSKVNGIFLQFEQGGNQQQFTQLFTQLYTELSVHSLAEEAVFYPALAAFPEFASQVKQAYKEQAEVKAIFGELAALDNTTQEWSTRITNLMRDVQQHVQLEEGQLFPMARQRLSADQLNMLGEELQKAKQLNLPAVQASLPMKEIQGQAQMGRSMPINNTSAGSQYLQ